MRGVRSFLILLVVALGFGAYLYFVEAKREPSSGEKLPKVFAVEAEKIDELTVKSESGTTTTVRKTGNEWKVVEPAGSAANADGQEVSGIATNLMNLEEQRLIEENPTDLGVFGLATPRIAITFKADGKEQTLLVGSKTPTGGDLYAKVADKPRVFLIASYLESTFNRTTFDLRDKTALKVEAAKVDSLDVTTPAGSKRFEKKGDAWQLASPPEPRADAFAIDGLVSRVLGAQMKSLAPATVDVKTAGLEKPAATATVGAGSAQATLLIGTAAEEGSVYARDASRPEIFTIDAAILDDVKKSPVEFRQKDLFDARSFNTTKVDIVRGGQTLTFEKVKEKDKDGKDVEKWKQLAPSAKDADPDKINALLTTLTGARADSFVDTATTAKPEITVALTSDSGKVERVSFSKNATDGLAVREGTRGVAKIPVTLVDDIVKAAEAIK